VKTFALATTALIGQLAIFSPALAQTAAPAPQAQPPAAQAPDAPSAPDAGAHLSDIIVTAQRRSESLQRAAISVSAIGGADLAKANITTPTQLTQLVPAFRSNNVAGPYANFTIRGIGTFSTTIFGEPAVVTNFDGVPLAFITSAHGTFYDLDRVEILKGPQGTLYGRNATGGVVNVITKQPGDTFGGNLGVSIGNYNSRIINGAVNVPISDTLTTRTAFQVSRHDGYMEDGTDDEDNIAGRFTARYDPHSDFSITFVGDYSHDGGKGNGATLLRSETATGEGGFIGDPRSGVYLQDPAIQSVFTAAGVPARNPENAFQDNTYWGVSANIEWNTPIGTLTVIPAHRETSVFYFSDVPTFYYGEDAHTKQDSIEARLASNNAGSPLKWLIGTFYLHDSAISEGLTEQNTALSISDYNNTGHTIAGFGQATYSITHALRLTAGVRYTSDTKATDSPRFTVNNFPFATYNFHVFPPANAGTQVLLLDASKTWDAFTYKAGLEFDAAKDSLLYFNVDRGFKAGVFFFASPTVFSANPEYVTSYTLGSKNRFFNQKLQLNLEAFLLDYTDQQLNHQSFVPGVGNTTVTENIGASKIYGAEAELRYLVGSHTNLNLDVQWEHARYTKFSYLSPTNTSASQTCPVTPATGGFNIDCSGRSALYTPEWLIQGGIDHTIPLGNGGDLVLSAMSRYESKRYTQLSYLPETVAAPYTDTDLSVTYRAPSQRWSLTAFVQNVENNDVISLTSVGRTYTMANGGILTAVLQPPRTFGARLDVNF
jgi:iron complex outermembrane receptor protein